MEKIFYHLISSSTNIMNLFEYTYNLLRQIPDGKISTYGAIARALGDERAARAVGWMMNQNRDPDNIPCYKIVYSDGRIGGFGRGIEDKIRRLRKDNVVVKNGVIINFKKVFFDDFQTTYPLKKLRQQQIELSRKVDLRNGFNEIETVAGIDVAYSKNEFEPGYGACVVMDYQKKMVVEEKTVSITPMFPYIPTYLAYRELPFVEKLVKNLENRPTILMLDGNGILHPFRCGLASHAGVTLNIPSVGVAKKLLCGRLENNAVKIDEETRGYILYTSKKAAKPVYVSPGHKISLQTALNVVKHISYHKTPEPLRLAHILAKSILKKRG